MPCQWKALLKLLRKSNYTGFNSLEVEIFGFAVYGLWIRFGLLLRSQMNFFLLSTIHFAGLGVTILVGTSSCTCIVCDNNMMILGVYWKSKFKLLFAWLVIGHSLISITIFKLWLHLVMPTRIECVRLVWWMELNGGWSFDFFLCV